MPTYEYACKSCSEHIEVVQSFRDEPLTTCPACGGDLRKVFGAIGIAFKGSGFYKTDSRPAPKSDSSSSSSSSSSSDSGSKSSTSSSSSSTSGGSSGSSSGSSGSAKAAVG
ncbi:MAG TPA: FmdB family zinc ribbon protein [Acidimicrobiales bacterium]|nr:FmdB family zinc ribbon protein [Acidimicrobiales bacterium]